MNPKQEITLVVTNEQHSPLIPVNDTKDLPQKRQKRIRCFQRDV